MKNRSNTKHDRMTKVVSMMLKNKPFAKILPESPEGTLWWVISSHVNMDWLIILLKSFNFTDRFTIRKAKR